MPLSSDAGAPWAALKPGPDGLVAAVVQHAETGAVLMLGYMNADALARTLARGRVTFFSRSRQCLWEKGETSGHVLELRGLSVDCDGDALLVQALPHGPTCHTGAPTCFFRPVPVDAHSATDRRPVSVDTPRAPDLRPAADTPSAADLRPIPAVDAPRDATDPSPVPVDAHSAVLAVDASRAADLRPAVDASRATDLRPAADAHSATDRPPVVPDAPRATDRRPVPVDALGAGPAAPAAHAAEPGDVFAKLFSEICERKAGRGMTNRDGRSYVRDLLAGGVPKIAAKLAEEAGELAEALAEEDRPHIAREAADLFFHALVGLAHRDVTLADVAAELTRRMGRSGIDEKAARTAGR